MSDRVVIVTGSSSGIGESLTGVLLERGWTVIGIARRPLERVESTYRHVQHDLADLASLESELIPELTRLISGSPWARVGLVNNAASVGQLTSFDQYSAGPLLDTMAVNLVAPIRLMGLGVSIVEADTPLRIVNVSSGAAVEGFPGIGDYCASKAGLRMAGLAMAAEVEAAGARDMGVFSYEPGIVETPMQEQARGRAKEDFPGFDMFHYFQEANILVQPEAVVAPMADFLEGAGPLGFSESRYGE